MPSQDRISPHTGFNSKTGSPPPLLPHFKQSKSTIRGFVNIDRLFNKQPLPKLMTRDVEVPREPRSQTSFQFFSQRMKESPELTLTDNRRSYITPRYLLECEDLRHSTQLSHLKKNMSPGIIPSPTRLAPLKAPFSRTTFFSSSHNSDTTEHLSGRLAPILGPHPNGEARKG